MADLDDHAFRPQTVAANLALPTGQKLLITCLIHIYKATSMRSNWHPLRRRQVCHPWRRTAWERPPGPRTEKLHIIASLEKLPETSKLANNLSFCHSLSLSPSLSLPVCLCIYIYIHVSNIFATPWRNPYLEKFLGYGIIHCLQFKESII